MNRQQAFTEGFFTEWVSWVDVLENVELCEASELMTMPAPTKEVIFRRMAPLHATEGDMLSMGMQMGTLVRRRIAQLAAEHEGELVVHGEPIAEFDRDPALRIAECFVTVHTNLSTGQGPGEWQVVEDEDAALVAAANKADEEDDGQRTSWEDAKKELGWDKEAEDEDDTGGD